MNADITLHLTTNDTITALPRGSGIRWAETALALAGFARHDDGRRVLSLHEPDTARTALARLAETAALCGATLVHSPGPHVGEVADRLADRLPGTWSTALVNLADDEQANLVYERLWDNEGPVDRALTQAYDTRSWGAILTASDGRALVLAERPGDEHYLAATLLDESYGDTVPADVTAPRSIAAESDFLHYAVRTRLLPAFEQGFPLRLPTDRDQVHSTAPSTDTVTPTTAALPAPAASAAPAPHR
ncbi:hypothetical protein ACFH04_13600 [Streptomyces noboritoensis]|uniref:Uncharacterized protein n=1 Tax=Streptomyces noboritoensis TaxID=67337 RepID=A0ABV6TG13_9ACTN